MALRESMDGDNNNVCSLTDREWLSTSAAAAYLGISEATLRNMSSARQVPFYKLGRRNRYRLDELRQLLLSNRKGA
jgi:excisionase family DNA binding protein